MSPKHAIIPALGIILSGAAVLAATHRVGRFAFIPGSEINIPVSPAAPDSAQNKFNADMLLQQIPVENEWLRLRQYETVAADSAGVVTLPAAGKKGRWNTLVTNLRTERYAKGKLNLRSNVRTEVLIAGEKKISRTGADSLPTLNSVSLELQPEKTVQVQINYLVMPDDPAAPQISLEFETTGSENATAFSGPEVTRRFTLETTTIGNRVADVEMSPDGNYLIMRYSATGDGKNYSGWSEVIATSDRKPVYTTGDDIHWMPRGARLYHTRKALAGDGYEMILRSAKGETIGKPIKVAADQFTVAPSEEFIIYYDKVKGKKETGPMIRVKDPDDRMPGTRDASYLVKQELQTGRKERLTYGGPTTGLEDISPDSRKILYTTTRRTPSQFPFYASCLVEMDLSTLATDTLTSGTGEGAFASASYSPDGKTLFITAGPEAFNGVGRNAGKFEYANEFDVQGFLFNIADKSVKPVSRDFNPSIKGNPVWNFANNKIYFQAEEGFYGPVYCFDPATGKYARLNNEIEYSRGFSIGKFESKWLATTGTSYNYAGRATLLNLKTGKAEAVADPIAEQMADLTLGKEEQWKFTATDGSEIDGMMILPPDFDETRKYPLIVYYYGGTAPSAKGMTSPYTPHLFASRDYVVYVLNPSGTTGYGQEFSARHVNAWGDYTADEIIEGVKRFCDSHPFVNRKKIGCMGASYGGFMTQYLLTKTDIFAAAISHAGISNVTSYWGEGYWGYSYNSVAAAKSYPWSNPELFTTHGSLFNADKIHTPLLLLHGNADTNVPVGESIQLFNALQILGRQVELIEVDGENHFIADFEKRKLWHATIMAWFAKWLQDDPSWWDSMYD